MSAFESGRSIATWAALASFVLVSLAAAQPRPRPKSLYATVAELEEQVAALQDALAAEKQARQDEDDAVLAAANAYADSVAAPSSAAISKTSTGSVSVPFGSFTNVVSITTIPAGSYVAQGIVTGTLLSAGIQCDLEVSSLTTGEGFRTAFSMSGNIGVMTLPQLGATTLSQPGRAFIACTSIASSPLPTVNRAVITLVRVPELSFP